MPLDELLRVNAVGIQEFCGSFALLSNHPNQFIHTLFGWSLEDVVWC